MKIVCFTFATIEFGWIGPYTVHVLAAWKLFTPDFSRKQWTSENNDRRESFFQTFEARSPIIFAKPESAHFCLAHWTPLQKKLTSIAEEVKGNIFCSFRCRYKERWIGALIKSVFVWLKTASVENKT